MTDTDTVTAAPPQLTAAMCELAELQYGMITQRQADDAGEPVLPQALVAAGIAEHITDTVVRLRAGARHPNPRIYAEWLDLRTAPPGPRGIEERGIASHSTALVLYDLAPNYSPVLEFTIHDDDWYEPRPVDPTVSSGTEHTVACWYATPRLPDWHLHDGLPVTTPAQTLWDLADRLDTPQLHALALAFAERHMITYKELKDDLTSLAAEHTAENTKAQARLKEARDNFDEDWQPWIEPIQPPEWIRSVAADPEMPF
jgi:hypothetical protein